MNGNSAPVRSPSATLGSSQPKGPTENEQVTYTCLSNGCDYSIKNYRASSLRWHRHNKHSENKNPATIPLQKRLCAAKAEFHKTKVEQEINVHNYICCTKHNCNYITYIAESIPDITENPSMLDHLQHAHNITDQFPPLKEFQSASAHYLGSLDWVKLESVALPAPVRSPSTTLESSQPKGPTENEQVTYTCLSNGCDYSTKNYRDCSLRLHRSLEHSENKNPAEISIQKRLCASKTEFHKTNIKQEINVHNYIGCTEHNCNYMTYIAESIPDITENHSMLNHLQHAHNITDQFPPLEEFQSASAHYLNSLDWVKLDSVALPAPVRSTHTTLDSSQPKGPTENEQVTYTCLSNGCDYSIKNYRTSSLRWHRRNKHSENKNPAETPQLKRLCVAKTEFLKTNVKQVINVDDYIGCTEHNCNYITSITESTPVITKSYSMLRHLKDAHNITDQFPPLKEFKHASINYLRSLDWVNLSGLQEFHQWQEEKQSILHP